VAGPRTGNHGEVRRVGTEPLFGLGGVDVGLHGLTDFVGGEQQVVFDLLLSQPDVFEAIESHESRRVTVEAMVDEQFGPILQSAQIVGLVGCFVPGDGVAAGSLGHTGPQAAGEEKAEDDFFHGFKLRAQWGAKVTRSGTGLH